MFVLFCSINIIQIKHLDALKMSQRSFKSNINDSLNKQKKTIEFLNNIINIHFKQINVYN